MAYLNGHEQVQVVVFFCWKAFFMFQRVLTTEFIDGVKISDLEGIKKLGLSIKDVSAQLLHHLYSLSSSIIVQCAKLWAWNNV